MNTKNIMNRNWIVLIVVFMSSFACAQESKKLIVNYKEVIVIDTSFVFDPETGNDSIEYDTNKVMLKDGPFKDFHINGKVKEEGMYKAFYGYDKKVGVWKFYNEKGELIREIDFDKKGI